MKVLLMLCSFFCIALWGESELPHMQKDIGNSYFSFKLASQYNSFFGDNAKNKFQKLYSEEDSFITTPKTVVHDFSFISTMKLKCFVAHIAPRTNFNIKFLEDMPLEVLDLTFTPPRKLSDLRNILRPTLKELYLQNILIDDASLLGGLKLQTLSLQNVIVQDENVIQVISNMKTLQRLSLGAFYSEKKDGKLYSTKKKISLLPLSSLSLTALDLQFSDPINVELLKNQNELKILILSMNLPIEAQIVYIAGKKFDFLNIPAQDIQKAQKILEQYHVSSEILLINGVWIK